MFNEVRESLYNKNENKLNIFLNAVIVIVVLILAVEICIMSNFSGVYVVGKSMEPTLMGADSEEQIGGDYVYVNKRVEPDYGDIVVVYHAGNGYLIKRAIAFGGDRVKIVEGQLYIKYKGTTQFVLVNEDYILPERNDADNPNNTFPKDDEGYLVQEGHFFLMGDNRNISKDSRELGSLPISNLDGVVTKWSFEHKSLCTSFHNFFKFKIPAFFGLK